MQKKRIQREITEIYHRYNGVPGYRQVRAYLLRKGIVLSLLSVHKYMNTELKLKSIVRRRKPGYVKAKAHKVFKNLISQDFKSSERNRKWCTDFTYLYLDDGSIRYNCSIIDLYDRSIIASITERNMTAGLAIRTLSKALASQAAIKGGLILHSDQGSQYTSKEFTEYCKSVNIIQSMSKAGYPYDNAPMERYFNTLKNDLIYNHSYKSEDDLYRSVEEYAYVTYNHVRPHSYNGYKTPYEARYAV